MSEPMAPLNVGSLQVPAGSRHHGRIHVEALPEWAHPELTVIRGREPGPILGVIAGVHGAEYSSIEAAKRLSLMIQPDDLQGALIICPLVNVAAFRARSIYVNPLDAVNLNRVFPGRPGGTVTEQLADALSRTVIEPCDAFIDLHGGDMIEALIPFVIFYRGRDESVSSASQAMAGRYGITNVISGHTPGSSYEAAAARGKPAILAEAGQQGVVSEYAVRLHIRGVYRVLDHLHLLSEEGRQRFAAWERSAELAPVGDPVYHPPWEWMNAESGDMWYPEVTCGDEVAAGQRVGQITRLSGEVTQEVVAPVRGRVMFLVTSLAINPGSPLLAIGSATADARGGDAR